MAEQLIETLNEQTNVIYDVLSKVLAPGDEIIEPSSWWNSEMVMLTDEENNSLDMRVYCSFKPYYEKYRDNWYFFPVHHVFRLPNETSYLLAQNKNKRLVYDILGKTWEIDLFPIIAIVMGVAIVFVLAIGFYECKKDNKGILLPSEPSYKKVNTIEI